MPPIYPKKYYSESDLEEQESFLSSPVTSSQNRIGVSTLKTKDASFNKHLDYPNKYKYLRKIANGSTSRLYLSEINNSTVIIKKISKHKPWRKELNILKQIKDLKTDKLLNLLEFYETERFAYIVTEYYSGKDLFRHVELNMPYSENNARIIIKEMLNCLKVCHDNNIAHLDVKCENYLVKRMLNEKMEIDPEFVLVDFGHSEKMHLDDYMENGSYGTLYYLCPESMDDICSFKSDIWAIGVCYHMLLTGDAPFSGYDSTGYMRNVYKYRLTMSETILEESREIILKCLEHNPKKRPTVDELLEII